MEKLIQGDVEILRRPHCPDLSPADFLFFYGLSYKETFLKTGGFATNKN